MKKYNTNPMGIKEFDIVEINFRHMDEGPFIAKVIQVIERFQNDLIVYERMDEVEVKTSGRKGADISFVTRIIKRSKPVLGYPRNRYYNSFHRELDMRLAHKSKGVWVGSPLSLAMNLVGANPDLDLRYGLDEDLVFSLWKKSGCPGLIHYEDNRHFFHIRKKTFRKWVLNNIQHLRLGRRKWIANGIKEEKRALEEYYSDLEWGRTHDEKKEVMLDEMLEDDMRESMEL